MIEAMLTSLQTMPPELVSVVMLLVSGMACLLLFRAFGLFGLYSFISLSVIAANLQVLKAAQFSFMADPVALGTIVFGSTYMATNIITEHYGRKDAERAVWIGFSSMFFMSIIMLLTLGWPKLGGGGDNVRFDQAHDAIATLFMPAPAIFLASFVAFIISQYNEIWVFAFLKNLTRGRMLWLRTNTASFISNFLDAVIFSFLAWYVLAPEPYSISTIWYTYILGTYVFRVLLSVFNTPFVYLSYSFKPKEKFIVRHV
jgi:queuosine precursor transporter